MGWFKTILAGVFVLTIGFFLEDFYHWLSKENIRISILQNRQAFDYEIFENYFGTKDNYSSIISKSLLFYRVENDGDKPYNISFTANSLEFAAIENVSEEPKIFNSRIRAVPFRCESLRGIHTVPLF